MKKTKVRSKQFVDENPIESILNLGNATAKSLSLNLAKGALPDLWDQILGGKDKKEQRQELKGDLLEGEELSLTKIKETESDVEPALDYKREILHPQKAKEETQGIQVKIQEVQIELKKLMASSRELQIEFKEVAVEQKIVNPGKYHQSFFEWMLSLIRQARSKVEDSQAWLSAFKSKHAKREYWAMFKKHGTTFGLSNERVVATQVG